MTNEELCKMVREGIEGGAGIDAETVFSRLREKYSSIEPGSGNVFADLGRPKRR